MARDNKSKGFPRQKGPNTELKEINKKRYYIDPEEYTKEVINFKKSERASERLGELFKLHVDRYATSGSWKGYTYLDEMKGLAILHLMKYAARFNENIILKSGLKPDAFKYCTTIIYRAFLQTLQKEKKHALIKDSLIKAQQELYPNLIINELLGKMSVDDENDDEQEKETID